MRKFAVHIKFSPEGRETCYGFPVCPLPWMLMLVIKMLHWLVAFIILFLCLILILSEPNPLSIIDTLKEWLLLIKWSKCFFLIIFWEKYDLDWTPNSRNHTNTNIMFDFNNLNLASSFMFFFFLSLIFHFSF